MTSNGDWNPLHQSREIRYLCHLIVRIFVFVDNNRHNENIFECVVSKVLDYPV